MIEHLTSDSLYSTILLLGHTRERLLVVEGPDDELALRGHQADGLMILPGNNGRSELLRAAEIAFKMGNKNARFLVDRDFDDYREEAPAYPANVYISDTHDLFTDLIIADPTTLVHVVDVQTASFGRRPNSISKGSVATSVLKEAKVLAGRLAAVRVASMQLGYEISFKDFSFGGLSVRSPNVSDIIIRLEQKNRGESFDSRALEERSARVSDLFERNAVASFGDHDYFNAIAFLLNQSGMRVGGSAIQKAYITAVRCRAFAATKWHRQIDEWCDMVGLKGFDCRHGSQL